MKYRFGGPDGSSDKKLEWGEAPETRAEGRASIETLKIYERSHAEEAFEKVKSGEDGSLPEARRKTHRSKTETR
jgi:hypothetical protein